MDGWLYIIVFIAGLVLLIKGADSVTGHAASLARKFGISQLVIGMTLVAASTTLPEFAVSIISAISNTAQIATGTIIGSNIANIGLILGISALAAPLIENKEFLKEGYVVLIFTLVLSFLLLGGLVWYEGLILIVGFLIFIFHLFKAKPDRGTISDIVDVIYKSFTKRHLFLHILFIAIGAVLVIVGANLLIISTVNIAKWLGVSEFVIALIAIAVGTSLPEFANSVIAALKKMRGISIGNILGANIFNTATLGLTSMFRTVPVTTKTVFISIPTMVFLSVILLVFMRTGWRISRLEGFVLLLIYIVFVMIQFL